MDRKLRSLSKRLSYILRHGAIEHGLTVEPDGYIMLDKLMKLSQFSGFSLTDVQYVVEHNEKKRFSLVKKNNVYYIRANQGHSGKVAECIKEDQLLEKIINPLPMIVHGTTKDAWIIIKKEGLKKMGRSHIHFAINDNFIDGNKEQSGIRSNSRILIYLDMKKAMDDGIEFYMSENKVVLSRGLGDEGIIEPKYFLEIKER